MHDLQTITEVTLSFGVDRDKAIQNSGYNETNILCVRCLLHMLCRMSAFGSCHWLVSES